MCKLTIIRKNMAKENTGTAPELTSRQRLNERFKGSNPELNVEDDEALGSAILGELDAYDKDKERMDNFNKAVQSNDIAPEMLAGILSGKNDDGSDFDLAEYLFDKHIDFFLDYIDGNPKAKDKLKALRQSKKDAAAKEEEMKAKVKELVDAEDAELNAALEEAGYKEAQVQDLIDWIYDKEKGFVKRALNYELKKDDFLRLFQIKDFDVRMADAEQKGYKRGKNEKIDMMKRQQKQRDSMPSDLGGGGSTPSGDGGKKDPYLSQLDKMKKW